MLHWTIAALLILSEQALAQPASADTVTNTITAKAGKTDIWRKVPMAVILDIPPRLKSLKVGMPKKDVLAILGLTGYDPFATTSGPMTRYGHSYYLRTNYVLTVTFDETKDSFRSARLDGDGWKKPNQ